MNSRHEMLKAIAVSVDDVSDHNSWIGDIEETQSTTVNFPIIGDPERKSSNSVPNDSPAS